MGHAKVGVQRVAPSTMARDLQRKFSDDLNALVIRTLKLMVEEIGRDDTINIMLTTFAQAGLHLEEQSDSGAGVFAEFVRLLEIERRRIFLRMERENGPHHA